MGDTGHFQQEGELFRLLFAEIAEPSLLVEMTTGRIVAANPASCAMLGYSREEMGEITPADLHPHELARLDAFFAHVRREGRWADGNMSCRTRDGLLVPAEIRAFLIEVGGQPHVLTLLRDLRDRKLADIGQSVQRLVHDLRNVLVTTQLLSDRLRDHPDAAVQSSAAVIARSVARALDLCRETIAAGRAVEKTPQLSRFFLGDVVAEVVATTLAEGLARLEFDFESDVVLCAGYDQTYRIMLNLVRNAVKAGARVVTVRGRETGEMVAVEVADDGPGLPETVRRDIEAGLPAAGGIRSGLGLVIAAELARLHGGDLALVETGTGGTVLSVTLPGGGGEVMEDQPAKRPA